MPGLTLCVALVLAVAPFLGDAVLRADRVVVGQTGAATIRGVVVSGDAGHSPIRRALVTLGGSVTDGRSQVTDDAGRFAFAGLDAGTYMATAAKAAFVTSAYGATRPGRPGTPIALAVGQIAEIEIVLSRGAVISGTLRDSKGAALAGIPVSALDLHVTGGLNRLFSSASDGVTDDRGMYRIFGLPPSEYVVTATLRTAAGAIIGKQTVAALDALFAQLSRDPRSTPNLAAASAGPGTSYAYAPTYFPGVPRFRDAARIALASGEERPGVDFTIAPVGSATIEGIVRGPVTDPSAIQLTLIVGGPRLPSSLAVNPVLSHPPDSQGRFTFTNVVPGEYTILARGAAGSGATPATLPPPQPGRAGGAPAAGSWRAAPVAPGDALYGVANIDTNGQDIAGVELALAPGSVLAGRVAFDGSATAPADLTTIVLKVTPPGGGAVAMTNGTTTIGTGPSAPPPTLVRADGTFAVTAIAPGAYRLSAEVPAEIAQRWFLRSAVLNGRDLLDVGFDATPAVDLTKVVVTFSDRRSELAGTLTSSAGQPAPQYYVIVLPAERSLRLPNARRVQATRPATDGSFLFRDLPAGDYLLVALTDVSPNEWNDPAFLNSIASSGIPVALKEGQRVRQDLRVAK